MGDWSDGVNEGVEEEGALGKGTADDIDGWVSDQGDASGRGDGGNRRERFEGEEVVSDDALAIDCVGGGTIFAYETSSSKNCAFLIDRCDGCLD